MPADRKPPRAPAPRSGQRLGGALFANPIEAVSKDEVARLKRQLRHNERIWAVFRQLEIRLIGAHSLREFVSVLATDMPRSFPSVDNVTLACFDPEYELTRLIASGRASEEETADEIDEAFVTVTQESLRGLFGAGLRPQLGPCSRALRELLFPHTAHPLASAAIAPLVLRGQVIGTLNQGSIDPNHFTPDTATDLLEHLAAVTAMCLDNVVNHERLRWYGLTDPLTGVANRRFFERRLGEEIERWLRRREPLTYMLVDIDHFKRVNDEHGHQAGDQVLQQVAQLLGRDLRGADLLARYGGEEFMLLLPNTTREQATAIGRRLCKSIAAQRFPITDGDELSVTVSIGIACLDGDYETVASAPGAWLFQMADAALYAAKQGGRNRVILAPAPTE